MTYCKQKYKNLLIFGKEVGEKVNTNKTKCMLMSRDQDTGRNKNIQVNNIFY